MLRFTRILALYVILMLAICASMANTLEGDEPATVYLPSVSQTGPAGGTGEWNMVAGNPERTSWVPEQVTGNLQVAWYRPIEAYIPQNSQIIAANGLLYIATARGLYALDAATALSPGASTPSSRWVIRRQLSMALSTLEATIASCTP
jgi:hypothetical protein